MEDHKDWEEGVEMDVEGEAPLDVVDAPTRRSQEVFVAHGPETRRDDQPEGKSS